MIKRNTFPVVRGRNVGGNSTLTVPRQVIDKLPFDFTANQYLIEFDEKKQIITAKRISTEDLVKLLRAADKEEKAKGNNWTKG